MLEKVKKMKIDEFAHLCNRLVREMGFTVRNSIYRENKVVMDVVMPVPGKEIRYIIIFLRKSKVNARDIREFVDFDTLQIRWMIITTGEIEESAKRIIPKNMDVNLIDGRGFEKLLKDYGIIREEEKKEISYLPSVGEIDNLLGWAEDFYSHGSYDKALEYVNRAISIKSTPKSMKIKVRILHAMGRYDEALSILKTLLESDVKDDESWFLLGNLLESIGREDEAEEAYGQCVRFNPRNLSCWLNRGNILFSEEKMDEALICYENALKIRQDMPQVWNNRGVVLKHMGKLDEAMRSYNAALKYDEKFADAYLNKAILFYEMRRYEEAENSLAQYLKLKEDSQGYILLANIYLKRQLMSKAEDMAKKALQMDPTNIEAKKILRKVYGGKVQDIEGELKRGIEDILNLLPEEEMEPVKAVLKDARELVRKGEFEEAKGKLEEAREKIRQFVDERRLKDTLISDIIELSAEGDVNVPENIDEMSVEELNTLRRELITKLREEGVRIKTEDELFKSLDRIRERMKSNDLLTEDMDEKISEVEALIKKGKFPLAMEKLLEISAGVEKKKLKDMKKIIVEDTRELLQDAGLEAPPDLDNMDFNELKSIRLQALEKIKGEKVKQEMFKGTLREEIIGDIMELSSFGNVEIPDNLEEIDIEELKDLRKRVIESIKSPKKREEREVEGLGGLVKVLQGGEKKDNVREELLADIKELSSILGEEIEKNIENMDVESLRNIKRELLQKITVGGEKIGRKTLPKGYGHIILQFGDMLKLEEENVEDEEYTLNAVGIVHFERGDYEGAIKYFKRALAINPNFKEAEFNLAYALHMLGKREDAKLHLKHIGMEDFSFD